MAKKAKKENAQANEEKLKAEEAARVAAAQAAAEEAAALAEAKRAAKAEARKKPKRPRFVREVTPKKETIKLKPLPAPGTSIRAKLMTRNIAPVPKDGPNLAGGFR